MPNTNIIDLDKCPVLFKSSNIKNALEKHKRDL